MNNLKRSDRVVDYDFRMRVTGLAIIVLMIAIAAIAGWAGITDRWQ